MPMMATVIISSIRVKPSEGAFIRTPRLRADNTAYPVTSSSPCAIDRPTRWEMEFVDKKQIDRLFYRLLKSNWRSSSCRRSKDARAGPDKKRQFGVIQLNS